MMRDKKENVNEVNENEEFTENVEDREDNIDSQPVEDSDIKNAVNTGEDVQNEQPSGGDNTESELEKKIREIEILTDTMKRRQADFENYKKRMVKNQEEQRKLAIRDMALDIININDDLLRAREAACSVDSNEGQTAKEVCDSFADGFSMISKRIEDMLKDYGIEEIDSLNRVFDPNFNEAVEIEETDEVAEETITKVYQKGFRLDDYLVRSAKVKVSKPGKKSDENPDSGNSGSGSEGLQ
ncbi:MAG: nucleotide exchange factor GrpE [Spirochaetes bacterium]|nr:nucleotide exchange factor GrpE [Spirochaetota bacterium]